MASSKQQKKDTTGNDEEGKKYNCQCGDSFSSVEELNVHNHKAH
jgi:hypothetical protein